MDAWGQLRELATALGPVGGGFLFLAIVGLVASISTFWALLTPLDTVQSSAALTMIIGVSYVLSTFALAVFFYLFSYLSDKQILYVVVILLFLICLPTTISATAMNAVSIANTRNLMAGNISI